MFTHKDIESRTIFVINCINHERSLRVSNGELLLEELEENKKRTLTKFPFQKILALFVIGHISVTTPLIEKCKKYNVALIVTKPNLRPVFYWADAAEGNYLIRKRQHNFPESDISVARIIVKNKVHNQIRCLRKTRKKDALTLAAIQKGESVYNTIDTVNDYNSLLGVEGNMAKAFFAAYFQDMAWNGRKPRVKSDALNATLDIGYTILFNLIEVFIRMFGFDLYVGIYHRLWFKRKSLVCDLMEPFRCIIDHAVLLAYNRKQFQTKDFNKEKNEYRLRRDKASEYYQVFYNALIERRMDIFKYVQSFYRCFMGCKSVKNYPIFDFQ